MLHVETIHKLPRPTFGPTSHRGSLSKINFGRSATSACAEIYPLMGGMTEHRKKSGEANYTSRC